MNRSLRQKAAAILILAGAAFQSGCVTQGKSFTSDTTWIKKDQTTQKDVQDLLGSPDMIGSSSGQPTWTYGYYKYSLLGSRNQKELKLYWNPNKTIDSYSFTSSFPDDIQAGTAKSGSSNAPQVKAGANKH